MQQSALGSALRTGPGRGVRSYDRTVPRHASTPRPPATPAAGGDCPARAPELPTKSHPFVRAAIGAWRAMTDGPSRRDADRGTLLACSAGADSTALAVALSRANAPFTLAHIRHDLRSRDETAADRDLVRELAKRLHRPFVESSVEIARAAGNAEANARHARYNALAQLASEAGLPFVATAHHADDQLETVLMRLLRGSGPKGLAAIRPTRPLAKGRTLIRPMLALDPAHARAMLREHAIAWREDRTNEDLTRTRAALRARVLPVLREIRPTAPASAARSAEACADLDAAVAALGAAVPAGRSPGETTWRRTDLVNLPGPFLADLLAREVHRVASDARGLPDLPRRERLAAAAWLRDSKPDSAIRLGPVEVRCIGPIVRMTHLLREGTSRHPSNCPKGPPLGGASRSTGSGCE